jgi:tight adherence protein B
MSPLLLQLLVGASLLLVAASLGVSAILNEQKQRRRFRDRLGSVASTYMRVNQLGDMTRSTPSRPAAVTRLVGGAFRLIGYDPLHAANYPMRWWTVMSITLVPARLIAGLLSIFLGHLSVFVIPLAWVMLCRTVFGWSEQRRRAALYRQFPDALAMIVRAVRVGIPLSEGVRTVAREASDPTRPEFAALADRVAIGVTLEDALHEMAGRNKVPEYRFFATALSLQSQTGGGLAESLEGLADVMRRRLALRDRGQALAAEAKTSIIILASLPFVAGGALAVMNPQYMGRLFTDPGCKKMLILAIIMLSSGLLVMRGMIRKALS